MILRPVLGRRVRAGDLCGGARAADPNRRLLARVAEPRSVSGSSLADLPAAVRPDPQGAHTSRAGHSWLPRRRRCPRRPAGNATTTTGTAGCATRHSCCGVSTPWALIAKPTTFSTSSQIWLRATPIFRSCTASVESGTSLRTLWTTLGDMTEPGRCVSATGPGISTSMTCGESCWTRCISTPVLVRGSTSGDGRCSSAR